MSRTSPTRSAMAIAAAIVLASCSGGSDAEPATPEEPAVAEQAPSTEPAPATTTVSDAGTTPTDRVDVEALQADPPEPVDPSATDRCDRFGYPCSWLELDDAVFEDVTELATEVQAAVDAADSPEAGLDAAVELLAEMPVVELIVDREGHTGMLYRLEGTPELFATTSNAAPVGEPVELDLTEVHAAVDALASTDVAGLTMAQGFGPVLRDYHPTGGPIVAKQGIVIDPQADNEVDCPIEGQAEPCFEDGDGRIEGSTIVGMMNAHPQVSAVHLAGLDATPWNVADLSGYDLVHVASHGSSGCANSNEGWTTGTDDPEGFVEEQRAAFRNLELDPDRCYSLTVLAPYNIARYQEFKRSGQQLPAGVGFNGTTWAVVGNFWLQSLAPESIVYLSHCTSGDGQLLRSGRFGSFVGWHSYARTTVAYQAGVEFWRLMVAEGVEFDLAIAELDDASLSWSVTAGIGNGSIGAAGAFLATSGRNLRARDVIEMRLDGAEPDGQVLRLDGMPSDGQNERFPADDQQLTFEVEGVRNGTADSVMLKVFADGTELESDISLVRDGVETPRGEWSVWNVTVNEGAIELPDTSPADFEPGAAPVELEVRAYVDQAEYSADRARVTLGSQLVASGPLPIFSELAAGMPAGGEIRGNDLRIEFDTTGGDVSGSMRVEMFAQGIEVGYWEFELSGEYDPASRAISGELTGEAFGGIGGITAGDSGAGEWEGTVDLAQAILNATLGIDGQSQAYAGTITPA